MAAIQHPQLCTDVSPTPTTYYVIVTSTPISIGHPVSTSTALWGTVVANDVTRQASEPVAYPFIAHAHPCAYVYDTKRVSWRTQPTHARNNAGGRRMI